MITEAVKQRFLAKLANAIPTLGPLPTPCLVWTNAIDSKGYGEFWLDRTYVGAHRAAWLIFKGNIPPKLHVLHRCDNAACVNVDHLIIGTHQDNMDDMIAKGRDNRSSLGERHPKAILTEDQVLQIYEMAWDGVYSQIELADMFDISRSQVDRIKRQKTWKHLWLRPQWTTPIIEEVMEA